MEESPLEQYSNFVKQQNKLNYYQKRLERVS